MGGRNYTYLGPYLRIKEDQVEVPDGKGHGCVNPKCGAFHRAYVTPFCAQCGEPNLEFEKPPKTCFRVDSWNDFQKPTHEAFTLKIPPTQKNPVGFWTPNHDREGSSGYIWTDSLLEEGVTELTSTNIQKDIDWLATAFAEEIERAREVYGAENVSIHWGRIVYYY